MGRNLKWQQQSGSGPFQWIDQNGGQVFSGDVVRDLGEGDQLTRPSDGKLLTVMLKEIVTDGSGNQFLHVVVQAK